MNNPKSTGRWPSDGYRRLKFCDYSLSPGFWQSFISIELMTDDPTFFKNAKYYRENVYTGICTSKHRQNLLHA